MSSESFNQLRLFLFACLFFFFFPALSSSAWINLEENVQEFVLETKKIEIPGYPHAFNASIISWQDSYLMSFRYIPNPLSPFNSQLGLVRLDKNFRPIGEPQILNLRPHSSVPSRAEDGRLIEIEDKFYIVYSDNIEPKISKGGFRVYVAEIYFKNNRFFISPPECLSIFEGANRNIREKNWTPFQFEGQLLLAYSIDPHLIFQPLLRGTGQCLTMSFSSSNIHWPWGELRGGTPALKIGEFGYLSFFHSSCHMKTQHSQGKNISHYFTGAYLFSPEPPFTITHVSPEPIIGKNFYMGTFYPPYWKPIRGIFPCGLIVDQEILWITFGREDHEIWIMKLDKEGLLNSLMPVESCMRD